MIEQFHLEGIGVAVAGEDGTGKEWVCACPLCGKARKLNIEKASGKWICFRCDERGRSLRSLARRLGVALAEGVTTTRVPRVERKAEPASPEVRAVWEAVVELGQRWMSDSTRSYLRSRLQDQTITKFQLGETEHGLIPHLCQEARLASELCVESGVLDAPGGDYSRLRVRWGGSVLIPVRDSSGQIENLLYRLPEALVQKLGGERYRSLPGRARGLFNAAAATGVDELFVAEGPMDTMTLDGLGYAAVGLPAASIVKPDFGVVFEGKRRVYLMLDNDAAGEKARGRLGRMFPRGRFVDVRLPMGAKDTNEYIQQGATRDDIERLKADAEANADPSAVVKPPSGPPEAVVTTQSTNEPRASATQRQREDRTFPSGDCNLRVDNFAVEADGIRATITALRDGKRIHRDKVPLWSAQGRKRFAEACGAADMVRDLLEIEDRLRDLAEAETVGESEGSDSPPEPTPEELAEAEAFLLSPRLLARVVIDLTTMGCVGDDLNKELLYVLALSRKLNPPSKPGGVLVSNVSSAGKSHEVDVVLKLVPPEDVLDLTSMSPQALIYKKPGSLSHKIIRIAEHLPTEANEAMYLYLRELLSKGELSRDVATKSPDGEISTQTISQKGPIALIETTTKNKIHPENMTRMWLLRVDESEDQTLRIHAAQRAERTFSQFDLLDQRKAIVRRHHVAQRLLEPMAVVIPAWWHVAMDFPTGLVRTRRDHSQFLDLISACALLHQRQRLIREHGGQRYIVASFRDYQAAVRLATRPLQASLVEVDGPARELYDAIAAAVVAGALPSEDPFTRRQIGDALGLEWGRDRIEKHIRVLEDAGLLNIVNERRQGVQREYTFVDAQVAAAPVLPSGEEFRSKVIAGLIRGTRERTGGGPFVNLRRTSARKSSP